MLSRFLSFFGFVPGLSGLSGLSGPSSSFAEDGFEAEGEAKVAFQPGTKIATSDDEENPDERRTRITDRDLVWPGRTEKIQISNPEPVALRFDLTVTDLDSAFYIRRPAAGGTPQREGGVLLQPGEEASFEVIFVPPPGGEKKRTRTFSFVLTCYDPRRVADPGEIVQDLPLRWVALPTAADLQIAAVPPFVVLRPWRREARFAVNLQNKSFLPPAIGLTILRGATKEALDRSGETVGTIEQSLAARTPGVWQCVLPPPTRRGSYYATVRGAAQTADAHSLPLALPRPVAVRYVPWLRLGRDWVFLIAVLLLLFWLVWGVPVRKTPIVRVSLAFAGLDKGQLPADSRLEDLTAQMILTDERGHDLEGQTPTPGVVLNNAFEFTAPPRWYGFRWFFGSYAGWNGFSRVPQHFRVAIAPAESEKEAFKRYDLNTLLPDGAPAYDIKTATKPFGTWVTPATYVVQSAHGVFVNLRLGALGALSGKELDRVSVAYALDGEEQAPRTFQLLHDGAGQLRPLTLDLTDAVPLGSSKEFTVKVTADGLSSYYAQPLEVRRQDRPFSMTLAFPKAYPRTASGTSAHPPVTPAAPLTSVPPVTPPVAVTPTNPATPGTPANPPNAGTPAHPQTHIASAVPPGHPVAAPTHPAAHPVVPPVQQPAAHPVTIPVPPVQTITVAPPVRPHPASQRPSPLTAPAGLVAQPAGPTEIRLQWRPVPGAGKYILYRSGGPGRDGGTRPVAASQTTFLDAGLTPGVIYHYRLQSKQGRLSSPLSAPTSVLTPAVAAVPVTVLLSAAVNGHNLQVVTNFTNVSTRPVYLDKISGCLDGKIGDDVFQVTADGQPVPFSGRKTPRPAVPGPRQFALLAAGETRRVVVTLNHSYRLPSGTHTYSIIYSAAHNYPARLQSLTLRSAPAQCVLTR